MKVLLLVSLFLLVGCTVKKESKVPTKCENTFIVKVYDGDVYTLNLLEFNDQSKDIERIGVYEADGGVNALYNCDYQKILLTYDYRDKTLGNDGYEIINLDGSREEFYGKESPDSLFSYDAGVIVGTGILQRAENRIFSYTHYITWKDIFETKTFQPTQSYRIRFGSPAMAIIGDSIYGIGPDDAHNDGLIYRVDLKTGYRHTFKKIIYSAFPLFLPSKPGYHYFFNEAKRYDQHSHTAQEIKMARSHFSQETQKRLAIMDTLKENAIYEVPATNDEMPILLFEANATVYDYFLKGDDVYLLTDDNIIIYSPLTKTKKVFRYPFKQRPDITTFLGDNFIFTFNEINNANVGVVITDSQFKPITKKLQITEGYTVRHLSTQDNQAQSQLYNENFGDR